MNILIGTNHLGYGGSESHAAALWKELGRTHDAKLYDAPSIHLAEEPDIALLSHNTTVREFFKRFPDFPPERVVQTIHGLWHPLEKPYTDKPIRYVAISEEIKERYLDLDMTVILNGVDLETFKPIRELPETPKTLLSMSQSKSFNAMLEDICKERGLEFRSNNKNVNPTPTVWKDMQWADICVAIGRSAYEAMACGCAVLLADHRQYQGALSDGLATPAGYGFLASHNCSGRAFGLRADRGHIVMNVNLYSAAHGRVARYLAEDHHNITDKCREYLEVLDVT